ncbi:Far upstream element-binding protein 1 [Glycine soja]|uniref:Far upstream element-binding protein 1 n=1 Tax=Glycine soja TaxID=3848 RepID=A0A0B2RK57_GLYSO|nr:Far upstream element-binding protein 1 [Glycine soja]
MAEEAQYSSGPDSAPLKRKYEDQPSGIELAKQRAQEVAARLLNAAPPPPLDAKRPKPDTGFDSLDLKPLYSASPPPVSYGHQGSSKKIDIPNGRVGVIIGKGGETIKYLQLQSGAKIQITRDIDADPNSSTRTVELMGTPEAISSAEKLINEVLAEAESGGSGIVTRRFTGQAGSDEFVMKIPNNKVGLIIGKGGETIKNMQASTGARIQVIPLHLPPGDTSTERTLKIDGTPEQIESAKQLVYQVISGENRVRNPAMSGGYPQQGYQSRPPSNWAPPAPTQQPGYGYVQPGAYSGPSPQYNMPQQPYAGYPPQQPDGYSTNWDQSTAPPHQHQPPSSGYNQSAQQGYAQDSYNAYNAQSQSGYGQPPTYDQQQGYGSESNPAQEGHTANYAVQGDSAQAPSAQPITVAQQGYPTNQLPSSNTANYPPQGTPQPGYGVPPTSQAAYGNQSQPGYGGAVQPGYGPQTYGAPQGGQPGYGQALPSYSNSSYGAGYTQTPAYTGDGNGNAQAPQSAIAKASP